MKKKVTKLIGSVLLVSMILAAICPLSIMAEEASVLSNENETTVPVEQTEQPANSVEVKESEKEVLSAENVIQEAITGTENQDVAMGKKEETAPSGEVSLTATDDPLGKKEEEVTGAVLLSNDVGGEKEDKTDPEDESTQTVLAEEDINITEEDKNISLEDKSITLESSESQETKATVLNTMDQTDGKITLSITNNTGMFKAATAYLETRNGKTELVMALNSTGYLYLFPGTYDQAVENGDNRAAWIQGFTDENGKIAFRIPIEEGRDYYPLVAISQSYLEQYEKGQNSLARAFYPRQLLLDRTAKTLVTGDYENSQQLEITNNVKMFVPESATLEEVGGPNSNHFKAELIMKMGTDSFDQMFVGTAEEAAKAAAKEIVEIQNRELSFAVKWLETSGKPETLQSLLTKPFITAWHSVSKDQWYERKFTINEEEGTLTIDVVTEEDKKEKQKEDEQEEEKKDEGSGEETKPDEKKEEEKQDNKDALDGSTAAVDSSTTLPDGVYTPDSFSFSGGSGRAYITCSQVTVTNGQAYAKIAFSSANYGYVKASGGTYYPTIEGGFSTFVIPVQLNQNNTIIGMTTAMSQPHEITYAIFVYIAAAEGKASEDVKNSDTIGEDNKMDETAPTIIGVSGGEEIKLEHAEYLKAFRYDEGIVLVEIDRITGTGLEAEELPKEDVQSNTEEDEETIIDEETGSTQKVKTTADYQMELYQAAVVKYLIVPEGIELPAGLDKKAIIIRLPKKAVYVSSDSLVAEMESLGLLDLIKATGVTEENCKSEALKNLLKEKKVISAGSLTDLNYTELVKAKIDLAIGSTEEILPKETTTDKKATDYQEQYTKLTERMALLDIPLLIDRSADEKDPKGQQEWLKLLGILFDKEAETDALITNGN